MSEPTPPPAQKTGLDAIPTGIKELLPAVALSSALPLMVFVTMPASNEKVVLSPVSDLFGFLTGRATKGSAK